MLLLWVPLPDPEGRAIARARARAPKMRIASRELTKRSRTDCAYLVPKEVLFLDNPGMAANLSSAATLATYNSYKVSCSAGFVTELEQQWSNALKGHCDIYYRSVSGGRERVLFIKTAPGSLQD